MECSYDPIYYGTRALCDAKKTDMFLCMMEQGQCMILGTETCYQPAFITWLASQAPETAYHIVGQKPPLFSISHIKEITYDQ
jgi:hypothetical protein